MADATTSPIKLEALFLESLSLNIDAKFGEGNDQIEFEIGVNTAIDKEGDLRRKTICDLEISAKAVDPNFFIRMKWIAISSTDSADNMDLLEGFARSGALYNILVFSRELTREISGRTNHGSINMPLINIQTLQSSIQESMIRKQDKDDSPRQPNN